MKFYLEVSFLPHLQAMMSYEYDCIAPRSRWWITVCVEEDSLLWLNLQTSTEAESTIAGFNECYISKLLIEK